MGHNMRVFYAMETSLQIWIQPVFMCITWPMAGGKQGYKVVTTSWLMTMAEWLPLMAFRPSPILMNRG